MSMNSLLVYRQQYQSTKCEGGIERFNGGGVGEEGGVLIKMRPSLSLLLRLGIKFCIIMAPSLAVVLYARPRASHS